MKNAFVTLLVGLGLCLCTLPIRAADVELPTEYDQHRFIAVPITERGEVMRLLTDTGGGLLIFDDVPLRLKLTVSNVVLDDYKGMGAELPHFEKGKEIPLPKIEGGRVPVAPSPVRRRLAWLTNDMDGFIGQKWFADRVWTLNYPEKKMFFHPDGKAAIPDKSRKIQLGFKTNERGDRPMNFPRIEVSIMGKTYDMLLATGSSTAITADALKVIDDGGRAIRATSLISTSDFDNWKKDNPDWRVIPNAEEGSGEPMIEVPEITIAGYPVGPVWFTRRTDENFSEHFSNWTDKPVTGAIGGNALRHFRVVLDYPAATAWFEMP